jgi:hypothetical protein
MSMGVPKNIPKNLPEEMYKQGKLDFLLKERANG